MLQADWRLTLLAVAALPLFIWPARRVGRALRRVTEQQMDHNAAMSSILQETFNVSGALLVKLFNRAGREVDRFSIEAGEVRDLGVRRAVIGRWFFAALGLVSAVGTAAVFWVGGYMVITGTITLGVIVMFTGLLVQLYGPLSAISNSRVEFATSLVSFERVFEVVDLPSDIEETPDAEELRPLRGAIEFDHVWFRYGAEGVSWSRRCQAAQAPGADGRARISPAMGDVGRCRTCRSESSPATSSRSSGRAERARPPSAISCPGSTTSSEGRVLIDGHDVRAVTLDSLADGIGVVTQETYLFHDTIAANLRYARPDATQQEFEDAAAAANIDEFIASLPDGYETMVGERGYRLSGGEKQRIAIARVHPQGPAHPGARRGHLAPRLTVGGEDPGGAGEGDERPDLAGHRPPAVHGARRRPDPGLRSGPAGGAGQPCRAARCRWAVQPPVRDPIPGAARRVDRHPRRRARAGVGRRRLTGGGLSRGTGSSRRPALIRG